MSHRQSVHDLRGLIRSFHSLIAIETVEEDRVKAIVTEVAADLKLGHLRILEDNPLFDRALSAIVKRLRSA